MKIKLCVRGILCLKKKENKSKNEIKKKKHEK